MHAPAPLPPPPALCGALPGCQRLLLLAKSMKHARTWLHAGGDRLHLHGREAHRVFARAVFWVRPHVDRPVVLHQQYGFDRWLTAAAAAIHVHRCCGAAAGGGRCVRATLGAARRRLQLLLVRGVCHLVGRQRQVCQRHAAAAAAAAAAGDAAGADVPRLAAAAAAAAGGRGDDECDVILWERVDDVPRVQERVLRACLRACTHGRVSARWRPSQQVPVAAGSRQPCVRAAVTPRASHPP
jgi:hypothetical protein